MVGQIDIVAGVLAVGSVALAAVVSFELRRLNRYLARLQDEGPTERIFSSVCNNHIYGVLRWLIMAATGACWLAVVYFLSGLYEPVAVFRAQASSTVFMVWDSVISVITRPLFQLGDQEVSVRFVTVLVVLLVVVAVGSGFVRNFIRRQFLSRTSLDRGMQESIATAAGYLVMAIGYLVALDMAGLDLSTLAVIVGALSIGIGFGLQNVANNFVSGLILLIERPIKVGDRIELEGINGRVMRISARSTAVRTNDNIDIVVPNSELVSEKVINWSQKDRKVRFRIPVGVAYGTDVEHAMDLMVKAAGTVPGVLKSPAPSARFISFGDSALNLEVRVWTAERLHRRGLLFSDVNRAVYYQFMKHDIQIPFPQQDVYIKSWPQKPD